VFITNNGLFGFIHIPKCGGSSIHQSFKSLPNKSPWAIDFGVQEKLPSHCTYEQYRNIKEKLPNTVEPAQWLVTVRHPVTRLASYYHFTWQRAKNNSILEEDNIKLKGEPPYYWKQLFDVLEHHGVEKFVMDNDDFINDVKQIPFRTYDFFDHLKPQFDYLKSARTKLFKIESHMPACWRWIRTQTGINLEEQFVNVTNTGTRGKDWTKSMKKYIEQKYRVDYKMLRYPTS